MMIIFKMASLPKPDSFRDFPLSSPVQKIDIQVVFEQSFISFGSRTAIVIFWDMFFGEDSDMFF